MQTGYKLVTTGYTPLTQDKTNELTDAEREIERRNRIILSQKEANVTIFKYKKRKG